MFSEQHCGSTLFTELKRGQLTSGHGQDQPRVRCLSIKLEFIHYIPYGCG